MDDDNGSTWLPTTASVRAAVLVTAARNGVSAPASSASLVDAAAWLVAQHAGDPVWCSSAVAAALIRPDNPARGEDMLEAGRRRARLLAGLPPDKHDQALEREGAPAPMPRWLNPSPRARVRYDLAECVAVATLGVGHGATPSEAVAVARAHAVIAALRNAVGETGRALVGQGLDHRVIRHLFAAAGLAAPAFLRCAQGPAWVAWLGQPHSGLSWPCLVDQHRCAQVFAGVAGADEIGAALVGAEWLTIRHYCHARARQIDEADRARALACAEERVYGRRV